MKLTDQVVSLELAKKLKELGVKQKEKKHGETYWLDEKWYWVSGELYITNGCDFIKPNMGRVDGGPDWGQADDDEEVVYAPTVAELGEMLPIECSTVRGPEGGKARWLCKHIIPGLGDNSDLMDYWTLGDTEADARAKMLIHLIETGIVKP